MHFQKLSKYLFAVGLVLLFTAGAINHYLRKPPLELSKQDTAINIHKGLLSFLSAGNKRLMTDLLWVQTLMESDTEHYKRKDLNNWLFHRFNTIAALDPKFYENYLYGGLFLGIIKDDLEGANEIYEKGLEVYPRDYKLNYNAGFLNYFERGDYEKGHLYLDRIKDHPNAPTFLTSIVNKLKISSGVDREDVFKMILHNYETSNDEYLKKKLKQELYSLKAEIDLECLNLAQGNCSTKDFEGYPYIFNNGKWSSRIKFRPYQIYRKDGT